MQLKQSEEKHFEMQNFQFKRLLMTIKDATITKMFLFIPARTIGCSQRIHGNTALRDLC